MEQWEIDLRSKLEKNIKPGLYDISSPGMNVQTGKGGYIEYMVAIHRAMKKWTIELKEELDNTPDSKSKPFEIPEYKGVDYDKLKKVIEDTFNEKDI